MVVIMLGDTHWFCSYFKAKSSPCRVVQNLPCSQLQSCCHFTCTWNCGCEWAEPPWGALCAERVCKFPFPGSERIPVVMQDGTITGSFSHCAQLLDSFLPLKQLLGADPVDQKVPGTHGAGSLPGRWHKYFPTCRQLSDWLIPWREGLWGLVCTSKAGVCS